MIHVVSYVDKLTFVLSADEETIPDPHQLCDDLEDSLKLVMAAVIAKQTHKVWIQEDEHRPGRNLGTPSFTKNNIIWM